MHEAARLPEARQWRRPPLFPGNMDYSIPGCDPPVITGPGNPSPPVPGQASSYWLGTVHEDSVAAPATVAEPATGGSSSSHDRSASQLQAAFDLEGATEVEGVKLYMNKLGYLVNAKNERVDQWGRLTRARGVKGSTSSRRSGQWRGWREG